MKKRKDGRRQGGKIQAGEELFRKGEGGVQVLWTCTLIFWTQRSLELVGKFLTPFQTEPNTVGEANHISLLYLP